MDKDLENNEDRRAQKRPHSPQKLEESASTEAASLAAEDVLQSDDKRDKLLRLLGGKKRKNETAASKWLERVRSREDELKVSTDLESQFNESLTKRLTGASRRHLGIGFKDDTPVTTSSEPTKPDAATPSSASGLTQGSVVSNLSQRASIPSLSSRNPRQSGPYHRPFPPQGYNMNSGHQMYPHISTSNIRNNMPPQCHGYPPQMQNYGGYYYPAPNYLGNNFPPPPNPIPKPPPPPDDKPPEPKSKNAFYAQFKKAS